MKSKQEILNWIKSEQEDLFTCLPGTECPICISQQELLERLKKFILTGD